MAYAAPEAGGEIAVLALRAMALAALLGYLIARGLIAAWTHSIGFMLEWLASQLSFSIPTGFSHYHVDIGGPFRDVDHAVVGALESWAAGLEAEVGYFMDSQATVDDWVNGQIQGLAHDAADTADWLVHSFIPKMATAGLAGLGLAALINRLVKAAVKANTATITKTTTVVVHDVPKVINKWIKYGVPAVIPGAIALPWLIGEVKGISHWVARHNARIGRLEKLLGVAGMAAVMANVLGLPNWRCLTRGNIGRVARHLCGLGGLALEDLLALIVDALVLENICTIIGLMESGLGLIEPELLSFVTGLEAVACYGAAGTIPPLAGPAPFLTPNPGVTLYLA